MVNRRLLLMLAALTLITAMSYGIPEIVKLVNPQATPDSPSDIGHPGQLPQPDSLLNNLSQSPGSETDSLFSEIPAQSDVSESDENISDPAIFICEEARELFLASPLMEGDDIREYQEALARLGYNPGIADGIYDQEMSAAVEAFQKEQNLLPTGRLDIPTQSALVRVYEEKAIPRPQQNENPTQKQGQARILINLYTHQLTLLIDGKPFKTYPVAVGKKQTRSPLGEWKIVNKGIWGNGFGTRWMGLNIPWGTYGIHGTNKPWSIGTAASHGCFRMYNRDVEEVYRYVSVGTPVDVVGDHYLFYAKLPGTYKKGSRSQGVVTIQLRLKQLGYLNSRADGIFGSETENAVKTFQRLHGLPESGIVDEQTKNALAL
ncbi:MAG: L,D-transpeptidase family protein [Bacillota bacterium]